MNPPYKYMTPASWVNNEINVFILGCGGSGSQFIDTIARLNYVIKKLGHKGLNVTVFDGDTVSEASVARQRFYPCDIGENKALLTVHRLNLAYGMDWNAFPIMFIPSDYAPKPNSWGQSLPQALPDLIVSCVDKAKVRAEVSELGKYANDDALFLDMGNGSSEGNVILGHWKQSERHDNSLVLPNVHSFYPELSTMEDDDSPSCSMEESLRKQTLGINQTMANTSCTLLWLLLREGGIDYQGAFVDIKKGTSNPINIL